MARIGLPHFSEHALDPHRQAKRLTALEVQP
jgi:hypothetical protein